MSLGGVDKAVRQRYGIARWRIDSLFERFIVKRADSSKLWKIAYVCFYRLFDNEYSLTDHGWVVVEGNAQGQFLGQYATRCGICEQVNEIFDQLV